MENNLKELKLSQETKGRLTRFNKNLIKIIFSYLDIYEYVGVVYLNSRFRKDTIFTLGFLKIFKIIKILACFVKDYSNKLVFLDYSDSITLWSYLTKIFNNNLMITKDDLENAYFYYIKHNRQNLKLLINEEEIKGLNLKRLNDEINQGLECVLDRYQNEEFYTNILLNIHKITIDYGNNDLLKSLLNIIVENRLNNDIKFNNFHNFSRYVKYRKNLFR